MIFICVGFRNVDVFKTPQPTPPIKIGNIVELNEEGISRNVLHLAPRNIAQEGMSGAPIVDKQTGFVIGMMSFIFEGEGIDYNRAYAVPVSSIIQCYPKLEKKNKGLKILEFLKYIGTTGLWYEPIEELYVKPLEYNKILDILEKEKVVLITGSPGCGKTYTAIYLLLEHYGKNYDPIHLRLIKKINTNTETPENKIENVLKRLDSDEKLIVYLEDPFGKEKFEDISEELKLKIEELIRRFKNQKKSYLLLSSREEILSETKENGYDIETKKVSLNLNKSYDYNMRKEILENCSTFHECLWVKNDQLRNLIFESLKNIKKFPTPLNIWVFTESTKLEMDKTELLKQIKICSKPIPWWFANIIKKYDEPNFMYFLSFPFITEFFKIDYVKGWYKEVLAKNVSNTEDYEFEEMQRIFEDKINVKDLSFSHPSYSEAIKYLIDDEYVKRKDRIFKEIFCKVLLFLPTKTSLLDYRLQKRIDFILGKLSKKDIRNFFFNMIDNHQPNYELNLPTFISDNFNILDQKTRIDILFQLASGKIRDCGALIEPLEKHFDEIPESERFKIMHKFTDLNFASGDLCDIVIDNFDKISENERENLLCRISELEAAPEALAYSLSKVFDKLSPKTKNHIISQLKEKNWGNTQYWFANFILNNFKKVSPSTQSHLFKLAEERHGAFILQDLLEEKIESFDNNTKEELKKIANKTLSHL